MKLLLSKFEALQAHVFSSIPATLTIKVLVATAAKRIHESKRQVAAVIHAKLACAKHLILHLCAMVSVAIDS